MRLITIAACLTLLALTASASHLNGIDPPASLVVSRAGMEWVYVSPCAGLSPSCGADIIGHHGYGFATDSQWLASFADLADLSSAFSGKCASPYFNSGHDHCDFGDTATGYVWHSPFAPDAFHRDHPLAETFLVRGGVVPEPSTYALISLGLAALFARRRSS